MKEKKFMPYLTNFLIIISLMAISKTKAREDGVIRITCVGDSITDGIGASNGENAYPSQLQKLLGDSYLVLNKGVSGTTVTRSDERAYTKTSKYQESLESNPDIVIILLGTNDITAKGIETEEGKNTFRDDYELLIKDYLNCGSNPKIMLVSPLSSVDGNNNHDNRNAINERVQIPLIESLANEYGLTYLDGHFYTATWTRTDLGDGLHPSDSGYVKLAKFFANAILGYVDNFNGIIKENTNYQIISKSSNLAMTIKNYSDRNGEEVVQTEVSGYASQVFTFAKKDDGYYQIINIHSKKALNVFNKSTESGTKIIQFSAGNEDNEKWIIEAMGDGFWRITPKMSQDMGLNVEADSKEIGANIVQWPFDGNDNNKWKFRYIDNIRENPY